MEEEIFEGCISCKKRNDLCNLFANDGTSEENYGQIFENCFGIKVSTELSQICTECVEFLKKANLFKEETCKNLASLPTDKGEEYLDESILEEAECSSKSSKRQKILIIRKSRSSTVADAMEEKYTMQSLEDFFCNHCNTQFNSAVHLDNHVREVHSLQPRTDKQLSECSLCGVTIMDSPSEHMNRCHMNNEREGREFGCHFCDSTYSTRKACFTHLRMKHGLKLTTDPSERKCVTRARKQCPLCDRDFSQKQILNKHLWKAHGYEVEKRKAFVCPLCTERVSYGSHFSQHLLKEHGVKEEVERLEFLNMEDFLFFKSAIQEETKFRFRKTTASKQTIEGIRSHYMCSQSGVYVYQGKGKRAAPERQIYKSGRACPAHMVLTETLSSVLVTFHKTHVGHGACPYYEPRDATKKEVCESEGPSNCPSNSSGDELAWICDACGARFLDGALFQRHVTAHGLQLFQCQYCDSVFQNIEAWNQHQFIDHADLVEFNKQANESKI